MLKVKNLKSGYGNISILHGVNIRVGEGEIVSIIGPNGAGKTTLMKTLVGALKVMEGEITFLNKPINGLKPNKIIRRGIGYVPQEKNIFSDLTVMENLEIGAFITSDFFHEELDNIFKMFPVLEERKAQKAGTLSGGERQMLAIASALLVRPKLLLLDEPCSGLAPRIRDVVYKKIIDINKNKKIAILWIVEQNPELVLNHVERSYILKSGIIEHEDKSENILHNEKFKDLFFSA